MRIYQGAPMRGYPLYNYQAMEDAAHAMRGFGIDVVSPHDMDIENGWVDVEYWPLADGRRQFTYVALNHSFQIEKVLLADLQVMSTVDAVGFHDGWRDSSGCQIEEAARALARLPRYRIFQGILGGWVIQHDPFDPLSLSWRSMGATDREATTPCPT